MKPSRGFTGPDSDKIIGRCHIYDRNERTELVNANSTKDRKIYTHDEFKARHSGEYLLDDYSRYISRELGKILKEDDSITDKTLRKELVHFRCKKRGNDLIAYTTMYHWGAIVAAPGYTDPVTFGAGGNPYGTSVTVGQDGKMIKDVQAAVKYQAKRTVTAAEWVKKANQ
ncbi:hypothetical protein PH210_25225 [Paenibacillus sp. BSR1-1]|uniref:hypothetical protein n=1 Tax=Paenibacillus sp. BSR1-1 TaxID=3020845 RepID=UPI0025B0F252|nr:hypothetical protein [Paenibacillus sp. BSR1-1]MDN3019474.1 hypothetical protein [Paenibacillus sp. BSR1-1]